MSRQPGDTRPTGPRARPEIVNGAPEGQKHGQSILRWLACRDPGMKDTNLSASTHRQGWRVSELQEDFPCEELPDVAI